MQAFAPRIAYDPHSDNISSFIACFNSDIKAHEHAARMIQSLLAPPVGDQAYWAMSGPERSRHDKDDAASMKILRGLL
jgi:hypothetical protein